jgi:class 3 adenylate cyclase
MITRSLTPPIYLKVQNMNPPTAAATPVTLLFIDLVSSTTLWGTHPLQMKVYRRTHYAFIRKLTLYYHGEEAKVMGDGFFIVFTTPINALEFSFAVQRSLPSFPFPIPHSKDSSTKQNQLRNESEKFEKVKARIGIHFGTPDDTEIDHITNRKDYFGSAVDTAKRIEGVCKAGCIAVSKEFLHEVLLYAGVGPWKLQLETERDGTVDLSERILGIVAYWWNYEARELTIRADEEMVELRGVGKRRITSIEIR